jgi:hypothetical protein
MYFYGFVFTFYGRFGGVCSKEYIVIGETEDSAFCKAESYACEYSKGFEFWAFKTARQL